MAGQDAKTPATEATPIAPPKGKLSNYESLNEEEQKIINEEGLSNTYDIESVITWRVFGFVDGTVLKSKILWMETLVMALLYWAVFSVLFFNRWKNFSEFVGSESTIRAFIAMFSTLIGLLLSFYTALNLGRWWQMREGVQQIVEGCKKLAMLISQCTHDEVLLATIHRYARASLFLIFAASSAEEDDHPRIRALKMGLITQEEADKLENCHPHMTFIQAETLWVWLANAVTRLHDKGLTKGPPHYCQLMAAVEQGRMGISNIQSYLETPIPLGYVHLLCLMVKLHNVILTTLMAMASVMLSGGEKGFQPVGVFRTAFRAFFMPFLYNAILILNSQVTDPFGKDAADFSFNVFDVNMLMSTKSYCKAAENLPDCLSNREIKPIPKAKAGP